MDDIYYGRDTKNARKSCPKELWKVAGRKLEQLDSAIRVTDLQAPPGNRLESLSGKRSGQYSIRINNQFRICFEWTPEGPAAVEIVDYH